MKKFFFSMIAAVAVFATSCVAEDPSVIRMENSESEVTFNIGSPAASRALAGTYYDDGKLAKYLTCVVYDADWNYLQTLDATFNELKATVTVRLVNNKTYNFIFWAEVKDNTFYTKNFGSVVGENVADPTVTISYDGAKSNDKSRDAFFAVEPSLLVDKSLSKNITLKRPFAQINFGALAEDVAAAEKGGFDMSKAETKFIVTAYKTLHFRTIPNSTVDVSDPEEVTFDYAAIPDATHEFPFADQANAVACRWMAMNYILVSAQESSLSTCTLNITDGKNTASVKVNVPNAWTKRNYRTNLYGNLLTDEVNFNVEILPVPEGEFNGSFTPDGRE